MTSLAGCAQADAKEEVQALAIKEQAVKTMKIDTGDLNRTLSYNGVLSPINTVHLASTVPGEILSVPVKVGDTVSEDDLIYVLDKENVERA
ncbi:hypothetical protein ADUPG1_003245, partial [Aduncisulcus paluster]